MSITVHRGKVGADDIVSGTSSFKRRNPAGGEDDIEELNSSHIKLSETLQAIYGAGTTVDSLGIAGIPEETVRLVQDITGCVLTSSWEAEYIASPGFHYNFKLLVDELRLLAASVSLPTITAGDGEKILRVASDLSGFEILDNLTISDTLFDLAFDAKIDGELNLTENVLLEESSDPATGANQVALYAKEDVDGNSGTFIREESDGSIVQLHKNGKLGIAIPPSIIIPSWQTDPTGVASPSQYPVEVQDAYDTDGHGADNLLHYVFPASQRSYMYSSVIIPFSGYDLRVYFGYRMSSSFSGDVLWKVYVAVVSDGDTFAEMANVAAFAAADDTTLELVDTPSATANVFNLVDSNSFKLASSFYTAGDMLALCFAREGDHASDTHTGNGEVVPSIYLKPTLPT